VSTEYRFLTPDDYEQASHVESRAFYNRSTPEGVDQMRKFFPPEWTVGAFVDGTLVADVRTIPQVRRMGGSKSPFGAVGPVACLAPYRRRGHVGKLLKLALETMRERGQAISGLHTPHDALYRRYGWERAEGKVRYVVEPKRAHLRFKGGPGSTVPVTNEDWGRLDALYRTATREANGPFARAEVWWREVVLREYGREAKATDSDAVVWTDGTGADQGYVVYFERPTGVRDGNWEQQQIFVRDFVALTPDAYLGLCNHILSHDLAGSISWEYRTDDHFPDLLEDPFAVQRSASEGAMLRIVDIERAIANRPYAGGKSASASVAIKDPTLELNTGNWRIEGSGREMNAERTDGEPEAEMSVNMLAPLYSGFITPRIAAGCGMIKVHSESAMEELTRLFAVGAVPYCQDWY
jgi:predicted acetyltransferase